MPLAIRVAVAAAVAGVLAHLVGLGHTSWAAVSAVAVLQSVNLTTTVNRGIQRALGTATGVVLGVATLAFSPRPAVAVVLVIVFQVLAELTVMLNYAMALVFATPLALLLADIGAQTSTGVLVRDRMLDTLLGVVVALAAALLIPNRRLADVVRTSLAALDESLARTRDIADDAPTAERTAAARQTVGRIYALRESYDAAIGEPWPDDLPAEEIVRLESDGHAELARLTR